MQTCPTVSKVCVGVCDGQQTYVLEPKDVARAGSTVRVRLREGSNELGHESLVRDALLRYCRFLEVPILFGDDPKPINERTLPWLSLDGRRAFDAMELATELSGGEPPLAAFLLSPVEHDTLGTIALRGVVAVAQFSQMSVEEHGEVAVLIRRMVVTRHERGLLPKWARFVFGVVDCPLLRPTASREQVRRDDHYDAVAEAIETQLLTWLMDLRREQPDTWASILRAHEPMLKRWALESHALFDAIADEVTFRTSRGKLRLPDYLERSGGSIYYFDSEQEARTMALLLESADRPVIDAQFGHDEPFLRRYAHQRDIKLVHELGKSGGVLEEVAVPSPALVSLAQKFEAPGLAVKPIVVRAGIASGAAGHPQAPDRAAPRRRRAQKGRAPQRAAQSRDRLFTPRRASLATDAASQCQLRAHRKARAQRARRRHGDRSAHP